MINPEILEKKGSYDSKEYCMSLPRHRRRIVKRSNWVKIRYLGLDNRENILNAKGPSAALLQHEIDHLNGVLFVDRVTDELSLSGELQRLGFNRNDVHTVS